MVRPPLRSVAPRRAALRAELDATRERFHALVRSLSDADWSKHSATTAWTVGELLAHLALCLELVPEQVERVRRGKGMRNEPIVLMHAINVVQSRMAARREDLRTIGARYAAAHAAALAVLDGVREGEWDRAARFFHRHQTIEDLLQRPVSHFREHADQIRDSV